MTTLSYMWQAAAAVWPFIVLVTLVVQFDSALQGEARPRLHAPLFVVLFALMCYGFARVVF